MNNKQFAMNPLPADLKKERERAGLTQTQAAVLVHSALRSWQQWEAGDRRMHPAFFELFLLKSAITAKSKSGYQKSEGKRCGQKHEPKSAS